MGSVPFAVGAFSKLFLRYGCRNVRVEGLPAFLQHLESDRGVLTCASRAPTRAREASILTQSGSTVANHVSVYVSLLMGWLRYDSSTDISFGTFWDGPLRQRRRAIHVGILAAPELSQSQDTAVDARRVRHDVQRVFSVPSAAKQTPNLRAVVDRYRLFVIADAQGKLDSWFFTKGQVIETFRGKGIYQKAIDVATKKLEEGNWVCCGLRVHVLTKAHLATRTGSHLSGGSDKAGGLAQLAAVQMGDQQDAHGVRAVTPDRPGVDQGCVSLRTLRVQRSLLNRFRLQASSR